MRTQILMVLLVAGVLILHLSPVEAIIIDFESLADSDAVTTQFAGLTFTHAQVLTAGISLNEFEFPPHSGLNVVSDNGGPITIDFATPQGTVSGFVTYVVPLTVTAFDAANTSIAITPSIFSNNLALSGELGSMPNELLSVAATGGIARVTIAGDPSGGSFTLDDLTYTQVATSIPEPSTLLLLVTGLASVLGWNRVRRFP